MEKRFLAKHPHGMPFSHGVVITKRETFIILAGQCARDRHGPGRLLVGKGDIEAQTRQVFENIKRCSQKPAPRSRTSSSSPSS
jgi:enamine deaminase RidA (YjgF/YER057c/UK114 family)